MIDARAVSLGPDVYLLRCSQSWQMLKKSGNRYEAYPLKNADKLELSQATACARIFLSHILEGKKAISFSDLSGKELKVLSKAGLSLPIVFEGSRTRTLDEMRSMIKGLKVSLIAISEIDQALFGQALAECAESEPVVFDAFVFKALLDSRSISSPLLRIIFQISRDRPIAGQAALHQLIDMSLKEYVLNRDHYLTSRNLYILAMIYSGFNPQLINLFKQEKFSTKEEWHDMTPGQFAAWVGADISILDALNEDPLQAIRSVCQDFNFDLLTPLASELYTYHAEAKYEDMHDFIQRFCAARRDPVKLLEALLARSLELDPLSRFPHLITTLTASTLLTSAEKIAMIEKLLDRHEGDDQELFFNFIHACDTSIVNPFRYNIQSPLPLKRSPLEWAVIRKADEFLLDYLVQLGASVHTTILHTAVLYDHPAAIALLHELGADPSRKNHEGKTPFDLIAGSCFSSESLRIMLDRDFPLSNDPVTLDKIFEWAIRFNKEDAVRLCQKHPITSCISKALDCMPYSSLDWLEPFVKIAREDLDQSLLFEAIRQCSPIFLQALLDADLPCTRREQGMGLRTYARHLRQRAKTPEEQTFHIAMVQLIDAHFLRKGIPLSDERTPFHDAAKAGDREACERWIMMLQTGYLPYDIHGSTPLDEALIHGHPEIASLIFNAVRNQQLGVADISKEEGTLLARALAKGNFDLAKLSWDHDLRNSAYERLFEAFHFIARHADLPAFQRASEWLGIGDAALHAAVEGRNADAAEWVLRKDIHLSDFVKEAAIRSAIKNRDSVMFKMLVRRGCYLAGAWRYALELDDPETCLTLCGDEIKKMRRWDFFDQALKAPEHKVLKAVIRQETGFSAQDMEEILQAMEEHWGEIHLIPPVLFYFLIHSGKSKSQWISSSKEMLAVYTAFASSLVHLMPINEFLNELFVEVFDVFQNPLKNEDCAIEKVFQIFQTVQSKSQLALFFNALQRGCCLEELKAALMTAQEKEKTGIPPIKQLSKEKKLQWLTYFSVSGDRAGFKHCYLAMAEESDREIVCTALKGIEKIGMTLPLKKAIGKLSCFFDDPHEAVAVQAIKTFCAVVQDPDCGYTKQVLLKALKKEAYSLPTKIALISLVGLLNIDPHCGLAQAVIACSHHEDRRVRIQSALTLSRMSDEAALIRAVEIVKSHDWDHQDAHFGEERKVFPEGKWDAFISRPEFQDSRSAMLARILDQLAEVRKKDIESEVAKIMQFRPNLEKYQLSNIPHGCRYVFIPIYFPTTPGSYLMRGLKARKGEDLFYESIRDLIRQGCGKSDLTRYESRFDFASWSKIGTMFATHDPKAAQHYFEGNQGCLILIDPAYYNAQYRKGFARLEYEGSLNNVFYNGIPKKAIKRIYLSHEFKQDFRRLNSDKHIDERFQSKLTSRAFKDCCIEELCQFRQFLHEKNFYDLFRFLEPHENIHDLMAKDGIKEITRDAVERETMRAAVAREVIAARYGADLFLSQDEMLSELKDADFAKCTPKTIELLHLDKLLQKTSVHDITLETIQGEKGGFGLYTPSIKLPKARRLLRLAALYHYIGYLQADGEKQGKLIERSAQMAAAEMKKHMKLQGITPTEAALVSTLIRHHKLYKYYLNESLAFEQFEERLDQAYQEVSGQLTKDDFCKLLWALFLSRMHTMKKIPCKASSKELLSRLAKVEVLFPVEKSPVPWLLFKVVSVSGKSEINS